ncbi:MAG: hypothetical protein ABEJ71_04065, partial [Halodesulfurarchaeum sp.]
MSDIDLLIRNASAVVTIDAGEKDDRGVHGDPAAHESATDATDPFNEDGASDSVDPAEAVDPS